MVLFPPVFAGAMTGVMTSVIAAAAIASKKAASNVTVTKEVSKVVVNVTDNAPMGCAVNSTKGDVLSADNPLIQTTQVADAVAQWVKDVVKNRVLLSGEWRADPRLDTLDTVVSKNKYAQSDLLITELTYSYAGQFHGSFQGRVMAQEPESAQP